MAAKELTGVHGGNRTTKGGVMGVQVVAIRALSVDALGRATARGGHVVGPV